MRLISSAATAPRTMRAVLAALALAAIAVLGTATLPTNAMAQATPPPIPGSAQYFVVEGGAQAGPFTLDQVKQRIAAKKVAKSTLAWTKGMPDWKAAGEIPALAGLFNDDLPPPPPPPFDAKAFLTGKWVGDPTPVPLDGIGTGTASGFTIYDNIGGMKGELVVSAPYLGGQATITLTSTFQGTYKAEAQGSDKILLTVNAQSKTEMTTTFPDPTPVPPKIDTLKNSTTITIIDQNTVQDEKGGISRRAR